MTETAKGASAEETKYSSVPQVDNGSAEDQKADGETLTSPTDDALLGDRICLKPKMTLLNGITVIVGSIIGSGIFVSPKGVLQNTGSVGASLVVWVACGLFSMVGAYCYAELGCMITKSGADYAYIMESFGPFVAFIRLWVECMIVRPCSQAIVALTFSAYVLRPIYPDCEAPEDVTRYLACICIGLLTFVNCWDVKWSTRVQDLFTYGKLFALVTIIVTGFFQLGKGNTEHFNFDNSETDVTKIALSFYSGLFAYNGWNYLNFVIEELIEPHKNLPKAIFTSCILVTVVYTLTIVAFHSTLSVAEVMSSEAVGVLFAERLYGPMAWIVPVFVAMSTFGGVNGILFTSSRLFYAGAEHNQMPKVLSMIQVSHLTPTPAVIAMCLLSLVYLISKDIGALINYVGFATWLAIGLAVVCVPYLRYTQPDLPRPIKVHLFWPYLYIICTAFITVVPMIADPYSTGMGCLIIASGVPVYLVFIGWKNKPIWFQKTIGSSTAFLQKLMVVVPSDKPEKL
ncbi:Y+L amino acid transporter 2 [Halotydeus destructor]|nr:Y+L amino acid transporter 2 [Halotydeus destructor]